MKKIKLKYNLTIFVGDIHGEWTKLYQKVKKYELSECNLVICGDIGIGFESKIKVYKQINYFNNLFQYKNIQVYAIRGNHDDPDYFNIDDFDKFSNIHLVPDYTILENSDDNILCIGGAISLDRTTRKLDKSYWINEGVVKDMDLIKTISDITIIATHSSPLFVNEQIGNANLTYWCEKDPELKVDVFNDKMLLNDIYYELSKNNVIKKWFYGHFHHSMTQTIYDVKFKMLDILEFSE